MNTYGWVDVQIHAFLASALFGGEWSASRPGRSTPGERASSDRKCVCVSRLPEYIKICNNLAHAKCLPTSHGPLNPHQVLLENEARLESERVKWREEKNVPSPEIQFASVVERRRGSECNERGGSVLLAVLTLQDAWREIPSKCPLRL
jgi:hypothetical protein